MTPFSFWNFGRDSPKPKDTRGAFLTTYIMRDPIHHPKIDFPRYFSHQHTECSLIIVQLSVVVDSIEDGKATVVKKDLIIRQFADGR